MKNRHMDSEPEGQNVFSHSSAVTVILTALFITVIAGGICVIGERAAVSPALSEIENLPDFTEDFSVYANLGNGTDADSADERHNAAADTVSDESELYEFTVSAYQGTEPYLEELPSDLPPVSAVPSDPDAAQLTDLNEPLYAAAEAKSYRDVKARSYSSSLARELGLDYTVNQKAVVSVTEDELFLAAAVIQLEVMGNGSRLALFDDVPQKYKEMLGVAECIRNRVNSRFFKPDTVEGVILQHTEQNGNTVYQFSPRSVLETCVPTDEAYRAAVEVLCDGVTVLGQNFYYFCATYIEDTFEQYNDVILYHLDDGSVLKWQGHLTTFYAGFLD